MIDAPNSPDEAIGLISYGSNDSAIVEVRDALTLEGVKTNYMRIRALPLVDSVIDFVLQHKRVYVIENNFDGQMHQIIRMNIAQDTTHMISLACGDTLPMTAQWIYDRMKENR